MPVFIVTVPIEIPAARYEVTEDGTIHFLNLEDEIVASFVHASGAFIVMKEESPTVSASIQRAANVRSITGEGSFLREADKKSSKGHVWRTLLDSLD